MFVANLEPPIVCSNANLSKPRFSTPDQKECICHQVGVFSFEWLSFCHQSETKVSRPVDRGFVSKEQGVRVLNTLQLCVPLKESCLQDQYSPQSSLPDILFSRLEPGFYIPPRLSCGGGLINAVVDCRVISSSSRNFFRSKAPLHHSLCSKQKADDLTTWRKSETDLRMSSSSPS